MQIPTARSIPFSIEASPTSVRAARVLIVANRLPQTVRVEDGIIELRPSTGGLATGLGRIQRRSQSRWIGWTGLPDAPLPAVRGSIDAQLSQHGSIPVHLSADEIAGFYERFANGVLWPVMHDMERRDPSDDWATYRTVNERYAAAVAAQVRAGDRVWVHDYQLMLVPRLVRERCPRARVGFFLHTPFPTPASFSRLPHARSLLLGLLGADVIGVHTEEYADNLRAAAAELLGRRSVSGAIVDGRRRVEIVACPMGIDAMSFATMASDETVAKAAAEARGNGAMLLGVDRLDYTKGIPERIRAFGRLIDRTPALRGRARLVQVAVPSRAQVRGYAEIRREVEDAVDRVNRRWGTSDWTPVDYRYGCVDMKTLVSLYRTADVMLVTPVRDGMNLVAKEFVASRVDGEGVLVLSERAGAAAELRTALLVDPRDPGKLTRALGTALTMQPAERRVRMRHLRQAVMGNDVYRWAEQAVAALDVEVGAQRA